MFHVVKVGTKTQGIIVLHIHKLTFGDIDIVATNLTPLNNKFVARYVGWDTIVSAQQSLVTCCYNVSAFKYNLLG